MPLFSFRPWTPRCRQMTYLLNTRPPLCPHGSRSRSPPADPTSCLPRPCPRRAHGLANLRAPAKASAAPPMTLVSRPSGSIHLTATSALTSTGGMVPAQIAPRLHPGTPLLVARCVPPDYSLSRLRYRPGVPLGRDRCSSSSAHGATTSCSCASRSADARQALRSPRVHRSCSGFVDRASRSAAGTQLQVPCAHRLPPRHP